MSLGRVKRWRRREKEGESLDRGRRREDGRGLVERGRCSQTRGERETLAQQEDASHNTATSPTV
jgi:hypothetical protein